MASTTNSTIINRTITIDKSAQELYDYWREPEHLPNIMSHLLSVRKTGNTTSHWTAKAPAGTSVEWDAEIVTDVPGSSISWRSVPDSQIPNKGTVQFLKSTGNRGTVVKVHLTYEPPLGKAGDKAAKLFGEHPEQHIESDLKKFKQRMETGEVATVEGQTSGRKKS